MNVIGVDAHKYTHTAAVVEEATGRAGTDVTVPATEDGHLELLDFACRQGQQRLWAIEDCRHVSGALERFLLEVGETVIRVPPNMMARARQTERVRGKSDPIDATAVARAAIREPDLPRAFLAEPEREISLLINHRWNLIGERNRVAKRLRWLLHDIDPALEPPGRDQARRPAPGAVGGDDRDRDLSRAPAATTRADDPHRRDQGRARSDHPRARAGAADDPGLRDDRRGADRRRGRQRRALQHGAQLALYAGVAPLDASSGRQQRHRLNRTGNRKLNHAIHIIAVTQARIYAPAKDYSPARLPPARAPRRPSEPSSASSSDASSRC